MTNTIKSQAPKTEKIDAQDEYEFEVRSDTVDAGGGDEEKKKDEKAPVEAVRT